MLYLTLKWLHVLGAIVALGANITYPIWLRLASGNAGSTKFVLGGIHRLERIANASYGFVFLSGIAMLFTASIPWTTPWVLSSIVLFIAVGFTGGMLYTPAFRKQMELAENPDSAEYKAAEERANRLGVVATLLTVLIVFLMTVKPRLWG
jgi:uncharacterized membrane protein